MYRALSVTHTPAFFATVVAGLPPYSPALTVIFTLDVLPFESTAVTRWVPAEGFQKSFCPGAARPMNTESANQNSSVASASAAACRTSVLRDSEPALSTYVVFERGEIMSGGNPARRASEPDVPGAYGGGTSRGSPASANSASRSLGQNSRTSRTTSGPSGRSVRYPVRTSILIAR